MDGNLDYSALDALGKKTTPAKPKKDDPAAREKIRRAAKTAKNYGYDIPEDVADDFYELTSLESGRSHYLADGKTVKTGVRTPNGDFAIGFSQVMGNTAQPYKAKKLDPYKEDDNLIIGLNEFYNGDKTDPIARRLAYVGGSNENKNGALREYRRTGKISDRKLYSYLPNNKETYADYVNNSGAYAALDKLSTADDFSALDRLGDASVLDRLESSDYSALDALGDNNLAPQPDILANLSAQKTQLEKDLKTEKSPRRKREIKMALAKLETSVKQTANEQNLLSNGNNLPNKTPLTPTAPTPRIPTSELSEDDQTDIENLGNLGKEKVGQNNFNWRKPTESKTFEDGSVIDENREGLSKDYVRLIDPKTKEQKGYYKRVEKDGKENFYSLGKVKIKGKDYSESVNQENLPSGKIRFTESETGNEILLDKSVNQKGEEVYSLKETIPAGRKTTQPESKEVSQTFALEPSEETAPKTFDRQEITLGNNTKIIRDGNQKGLNTGEFRFKDADGETYIVNGQTGEIKDESLNKIVDEIQYSKIPLAQKLTVTTEKAREAAAAQVAQTISERHPEINREDAFQFLNKYGFITDKGGNPLPESEKLRPFYQTEEQSRASLQAGYNKTAPSIGNGKEKNNFNDLSDTNYITRRNLRELTAFSKEAQKEREDEVIKQISEGKTPDAEWLNRYGIKFEDLDKNRRDEYQMALTKGKVSREDFERFKQDFIKSGQDDYEAKINASRRMTWMKPNEAEKEIEAYRQLKREKQSEFAPKVYRKSEKIPVTIGAGEEDMQRADIKLFSEDQAAKMTDNYLERMLSKYGSAAKVLEKRETAEREEEARKERLKNMGWTEYTKETIKSVPFNIIKGAISTAVSSTLQGAVVWTKPAADFIDSVFGTTANYHDIRKHPLYKAGLEIDEFLNDTLKTNRDLDAEFFQGNVPQAVGSSIGLMFPSLSNKPKVAIALFSTLGMSGSSYEGAIRAGASDADAQKFALLNGGLFGWTEIVGVGNALERLNTGTGGTIWRQLFRNSFKESLKESGEEIFLNEGPQTIGENYLASITYDPDRKLDKDLAENLLAAGFSATTVSTGVTVLNTVRNQRQINKQLEIDKVNGGSVVRDFGESGFYVYGKETPVNDRMKPFVEQRTKLQKEISDAFADLEQIKQQSIGETPDNVLRYTRQAREIQVEINRLATEQQKVSQQIADASGVEKPDILERKEASEVKEPLQSEIQKTPVAENEPQPTPVSNFEVVSPETEKTNFGVASNKLFDTADNQDYSALDALAEDSQANVSPVTATENQAETLPVVGSDVEIKGKGAGVIVEDRGDGKFLVDYNGGKSRALFRTNQFEAVKNNVSADFASEGADDYSLLDALANEGGTEDLVAQDSAIPALDNLSQNPSSKPQDFESDINAAPVVSSPLRQRVRQNAARLFGSPTGAVETDNVQDGAKAASAFTSSSVAENSPALKRVADTRNASDIALQNELRANPSKMELLPDVSSTVDGDTVKVSLQASEILRLASALISDESVNDAGLFGGLYFDKQDVANYTEVLNEIGNLIDESGGNRTTIDKLKNNILEAAKENGSAVVNIYDDALPHERIHQGSDIGSQNEAGESMDYIERYATPETIENDVKFQTFRAALNRLESRVVPTGEAIEEAFAYLGSGDYERFNLTENEAVELLQNIVLSYVAKNGVESLRAFDKTEIRKVYESIEAKRKQNAGTKDGNQSRDSASGGGIGRRGESGQQSSGAESAANDTSEQRENVSYFETKSDDAKIRAAQEKIERVGVSAAFAESLNPNAKQTAEHTALQIETIKLFNRQAKEAVEANNKIASTAKLHSAIDILLAAPFDGIYAGEFVDQLAAIGETDAKALTKYIESRRARNGNADLLTERESAQMREDTEKLNSLNVRLETLTNKSNDYATLKQALKMALPSLPVAAESVQSESETEATKIRKQRDIARRQLLNRVKSLENRSDGYAARMARVYKALLVSAVQTTVNNVLTAEGTRKIENISDLAEVVINKTLAAVNLEYEYKNKLGSDTRFQDIFHLLEREDYTTADVAKHFFTDAVFARSIANATLEEFPALYESLFGSYASDIEAASETAAFNLPDRILRAVEKGADAVNVLNRLQEYLVRSQEFNYALQLKLGQKDLNLADVIRNKQIVEKISESDLTFAINRALRVTFALKPDTDTPFGRLIDLYQQRTPAALSPFLITFPNFMYNATKFVTDYAPAVGIAKAALKAARTGNVKEEINPRVIAQQLVGSAMFLSALALVRAAGDDDKWYLLRVPQTEYYVDVRPYQPFASMIFLANKANRAIEGKPVFTDRDTAVAETLEAMTGLSTRNLIENKIGQILWRGTLGRENDGRDWERIAYLAKQQLGEIGGGFLRPLKTVKDLVSQFDEYERTVPNTINRPGSQGIARSLPFANRILQLEARRDFVTGRESKQTAPALKIFGITLVNPDMHKEPPTQALVMLREMTDNFKSEKDILPEAQEKAAVKSSIYRAMRAAGGLSDKEEAVREAIKRAENLGILKPGEVDFVTRQQGLSEMQSLAKRLDLEKIERVLQIATDTEKENLAPVVEAKRETEEKREKRKATERFINQVRRGEVSREAAEKTLDNQLEAGQIDEKEYRRQLESMYLSEAESEVKKLDAASASDFAKIEKLVLNLNPEDREGVYNQLLKKTENKLKNKDTKSYREAERLMEIIRNSFSDFESKK